MAEPSIAYADMAGNRSAQISGEQDCAEDGSSRNEIYGDAGQQKDADSAGKLNGISQFAESLDCRHRQWPDQLKARIHQQEQHDEAADDPSGPERPAGSGSLFRRKVSLDCCCLHDFSPID